MAEETNVPQDGVNELSQKSEFLAPASIGANLYEPAASPMFDINNLPGKANVSNAAYRVKDITTGSAPNYPNKVVSPKSKKFSFAQGLADELDVVFANNVDNNAYNKLYAYDSSPKGAHKARYKAYGQETYDRIGFSPEIDNETWFNQNTTMYDDWKRMATQAAWPMMKLGFMSPIKSYGKLMGGADIGQDIEEARDYEEYNAIGMSTKGGVGGFLVNLQNSAAYSVGILTEGVVEGALIGGAIGAIGGEGVGAIPGAAIGGILEGFETLAKLPASLINMSKNLGKMTMNLKKLQNISEVRNVFNNAGRAMGNFINPLSNTSEAAMKYVFNNPDDLSNLARSARTVGAMWHDVKNMNLALSEGRLEGGFTENKVYEELYNKYYEKYNVAPNDDLQKSMREQAKVAGFQNTFKNTLLVHYSNNIAFPSITRAGFLKGIPRFSETIGRIGSEYNLIFNPGKTVAEGLYTAEKVSLLNAAKALTKPATYGKTALNYFKANFVEGFQESAQDVLSDATERYYVDSFKNKDRQNFEYSMATLNAAMKKQISAQGLETFASGFAMGSILSIPGGVKDFLSVGYNKYYKYRGNYEEHIKERGEAAADIADALNDMHKNGQNFFDPRLNNYTTQMLVGKVADDPDGNSTKELKDASFTGFFSSVHTALRSGTFDLFLKNFEGYKQATPEELEQAWKLEPGQGAKALLNIDSAITSAKKTAERYQFAKKKFTNVLNPNDFAENTPEREQAEIYNQAYLEGIHNLTFMGAAFDNNAERLSSMYSKLSSIPTLQNSRFSDIALLTEPERLGKEINMLRTEVKLGEQAVTPEAKTLYKEQKQLLDTLESYQKEQAGATVEFTKKLITATIDIIKANPNMAPNEARAKAVEQIEEEYAKAGLNPFVNYKNSFKSVLNTLAGSEENINTLDRQLDEKGGLDDLFETLMDTHILRNENNNLNKYINILNSPKSFYEHVQRNFDWMQKLYNNREDYYNDIINNSLINIQRNTLLEELAEDGIYVDLEEFAQWCEDKTPPSYFIDQVNKRIINKDSYLYDKYMEMFDKAEDAEVTNPPMPKSDADKKMQMQVDTLNEQREAALEKEKLVYDKDLKEVLGYTQDEIDEQRNIATFDNEMDADDLAAKIDLFKRSIKQLDSSNPIEIEAVVDLVDEESLLTPTEVNSAKEDLFGNEAMIAQVAALAEMFTDLSEQEAFETASNALIFKDLLIKRLDALENQSTDALAGIPEYEGTQPYTEYNKSVETINTKFDRLIEEAIFNFRKAQKEEVDSNRPEAMKKSIKQVKDLFDTKGDIVQTKRNYIVEGEPNERMSNRIKSGYDTYTYTGSQALSDLFDTTIGAALVGNVTQSEDIEAKKADIERMKKRDIDLRNSIIPQVTGSRSYDESITDPNSINKGVWSSNEEAINAMWVEMQEISDWIESMVDANVPVQKIIDKVGSLIGGQGKASWMLQTNGKFNLYDYIKEKSEGKATTSLIDLIKSSREEINAKYDAELAALEQPSDIETQKADIAERKKKSFSRQSNGIPAIGFNYLTDNGQIGTYYSPDGTNIAVEAYTEKEVRQKLNDLYDAELNALEKPTGSGELNQDVIDNFISALEEANLPGVNSNKFTLPTVKDELETLIAPEGTRLSKKTQDYIGKLETQIEEVDTKLATVKNKKREAILNKQKAALQKAIEDEQSGVYNEKFDMTIENIKSFVSNTVKENAYQESRDGGDLIDPMLKAYLDTATSVKPAFDPKLMTKEAYDALFDDETGYLTNLKRMADAGEIYIFTKNLYVHSDNLVDNDGNKLPPVAGEIDMIIVDRKGNKFIVDLKTGKQDKWNYYKVLNSKSYQKQLENTLQQTGYANLAQNRLGEEFGIKILPIEVAYDKDGKLISAGKPSNLVLFSDEEVIGNEGTEPYTISLDSNNIIQAKNPETGFTENISIADLMQRLVPNLNNKTTVKGKPVKNKESVPENEQAIVDSFIIKMNESDNMFDSFEELDTLKPTLSKTSYDMLKNLVDEKVNSMLNGISENVLKSGEIYIFTKALKSMKIPQGYKVILNSINFESGNVELSRVGPGRKKDITMSIADFNKVAELQESLSDTPTGAEEYVLTEGETENINDSMDTINNELGDPNQLIKWKEEAAADNITADELEDDFFTNFKCEIK
jgi:hypothetical protein